MEHVTYRKCVMERLIGRQRQTTWVPENLARIGSVLKMRQAAGPWENEWQVKDVTIDPPETFKVALHREWELVRT